MGGLFICHEQPSVSEHLESNAGSDTVSESLTEVLDGASTPDCPPPGSPPKHLSGQRTLPSTTTIMRSSRDNAIPYGDDGWHHPPARSRSHTVSGTHVAQHPLPPDAALSARPPSPARRSSFLASAFGKLVSSPPLAHPSSVYSPGSDSTSSSSGARTPPYGSVTNVTIVDDDDDDDDDDHSDELHDHVHDYTPLSRMWSGKRRSSWSAATSNGSRDSAYSASAPSGGGVLAYLGAQQRETSADVKLGESPVGLFRRLSMGSSQKPPTFAAGPETTRTAGFSVPEKTLTDAPAGADERLGRNMQRRSSSARRLSPMSEKLLRGHYEF